MTACFDVPPDEKERVVLRLLAGTAPATLADALGVHVRDVLAWASAYLEAGRAVFRSETPAGNPFAGRTGRCDPGCADESDGDEVSGDATGPMAAYPGGGSPPVTFSAVAGTRADLGRVQQEWQDIVGTDLTARTQPPEFLPAPPGVADRLASAFRIAEYRHDPGAGGGLALRVRRGLRERGLVGVIVEEGFFLEPAAGAVGAGGATGKAAVRKAGVAAAPTWETVWWRDDLRAHEAFQPTPVPPGALGADLLRRNDGASRVALIDTGDERAGRQHLGPDPGERRDAIGHGTSVGDLIRLAYGESHDGAAADLECYRVFHGGAPVARSVDVALALSFAIAARFTIVVLPLFATVAPEDRYGWDHHHSLLAGAVEGTGRQTGHLPVFVCAGGNMTGVPMRLPATLPGAVVVRATDWSNMLTAYNSRTPLPPPCLVDVLGGDLLRPLGYRGPPGTPDKACFGTSFGAALVAGTLVARTQR